MEYICSPAILCKVIGFEQDQFRKTGTWILKLTLPYLSMDKVTCPIRECYTNLLAKWQMVVLDRAVDKREYLMIIFLISQ